MTNNTSTSNNTSNVVAKVFVKKLAKREFGAAVKFNGQWVTARAKQSRSAVKAVEEVLQKLGAPKVTFQVVKVEPKVETTVETKANNSSKAFKLDSCKVETTVEPKVETKANNSSKAFKLDSCKVETTVEPKVETKANNSSKAFKLDSCYAWAVASSAAVAKMLGMIGVDDAATLKAERLIAYKVAYVAASRASIKGSVVGKVSKFEKDLIAAGREVVFLDAVRENIKNAGFEIAS
jgi:hypothetical protein